MYVLGSLWIVFLSVKSLFMPPRKHIIIMSMILLDFLDHFILINKPLSSSASNVLQTLMKRMDTLRFPWKEKSLFFNISLNNPLLINSILNFIVMMVAHHAQYSLFCSNDYQSFAYFSVFICNWSFRYSFCYSSPLLHLLWISLFLFAFSLLSFCLVFQSSNSNIFKSIKLIFKLYFFSFFSSIHSYKCQKNYHAKNICVKQSRS